MRLPDAEGFIAAAQEVVRGHDVVYLHDAEGKMVVALLPMPLKQRIFPKDGPMPNHDHIEPEMGEEVPWAAEHEPPLAIPIPPDYWETAE